MNIVIIDSDFPNHHPERAVFEAAGLAFSKLARADEEAIAAAGNSADAVLVQFAPLTREVLRQWTRCKLIVRYGIGVDNVDVEAATEAGIQVCNVSTYCLDEVADHTVAMILALSRKLLPAHRSIRDGRWELVKPLPKLEHTDVGIVGFGRIGERVLQRLRPFRCRVGVYDPFLSGEAAGKLGVEPVGDLDALLARSDIVTLHAPLLPETRHLINERTLARMKPTAALVNTSRGALVDTVALAGALRQGRLGFAALDVFEQEPLPASHPLQEADNVLLTPHVAYYSDASLDELQRSAAAEIVRWTRGEALESPINRVYAAGGGRS